MANHLILAMDTLDLVDAAKFGEVPKLLDRLADDIVRAKNTQDALKSSLAEMLEVYWGRGDGRDPAPVCILNAQAALARVA